MTCDYIRTAIRMSMSARTRGRTHSVMALVVASLILAACSTTATEDAVVDSQTDEHRAETPQTERIDEELAGLEALDDATATDVPSPPAAGETVTPTEFGFGVSVPVVWSAFGDADGSVWNTRVGVIRDVTVEVLAANQFNDPPPDGVVFAGFDVEMTLVEAAKEPLSPGFNFQWEILGGSSAGVYDASTMADLFGCGVSEGEFNDFAEVFVGGSLSGLVCLPLPVEDLGDPGTRVAMNFSGERITFGS